MHDLIRESSLGACLRWLTKNRVLRHPEERPDFVLPRAYARSNQSCRSRLEPLDNASVDQDPVNNHDKRPSAQIDTSIVTWYSESDPENPQNWSAMKKGWTSMILLIYTFGVYMGESTKSWCPARVNVTSRLSVLTRHLNRLLALHCQCQGCVPDFRRQECNFVAWTKHVRDRI